MTPHVVGSTTAVDSRPRYALTLNGPPARPPLGDLTNTIHPICRRANWNSHINYDILHPGLQLVSKLLSTPTSLSFFHTLFFGKRQREHYILYPLARDKTHFEFVDHPTSLRPYQERKVEAQLIKLADSVSFVVVNEAAIPAQIWEMSTNSDAEEKNFEIHMEQAGIEELGAAAAEYANTGAKNRYQLASFLFARTICHEIAHVAYSYFYSYAGEICYFPGSSICEPGYEWEHQVFSGLISEERVGVYDAYIRLWPNPRSTQHMLDDQQDIGIRLKHSANFLPTLTDEGKYTNVDDFVLALGVDSSYFERLFSEKFWTEDLVEQGPSALHPEAREDSSYRILSDNTLRRLQTLYSYAMHFLEEAGENCKTAEEHEELRRLCEPWGEFMQLSLSGS